LNLAAMAGRIHIPLMWIAQNHSKAGPLRSVGLLEQAPEKSQ
jgi:hypothetical protein